MHCTSHYWIKEVSTRVHWKLSISTALDIYCVISNHIDIFNMAYGRFYSLDIFLQNPYTYAWICNWKILCNRWEKDLIQCYTCADCFTYKTLHHSSIFIKTSPDKRNGCTQQWCTQPFERLWSLDWNVFFDPKILLIVRHKQTQKKMKAAIPPDTSFQTLLSV